MSDTAPTKSKHFLETIIEEDLASNKHEGRVVTRFPPEPNGYLHVGHARSIWVNFGLAQQYGGVCNLRFDDTNPEKESQEFIDAIQEDVRWLGYEWNGDARYASSYFDKLYEWALHLIREGKAYVCELSAEQASEYRGWATKPGKDSPYRERSVEENLDLFETMRAGGFDEGAASLRAKIDMASPNMNLRDPILYRIRKVEHHQTGDKWCIYPSYDFAHGQEDAIEGVTHSICTLEFQSHRALYDWFVENLPVPTRPTQYEMGRLNLNYTVTSKRKLKQLVDENHVAGWDDPRMPTISGMRRRGFTPNSLKSFCEMIPVSAKNNSDVDVAQLEKAIRDDLNEQAPRAMCVMNPLKVTVINIDEADSGLEMKAANHPNKPELGERVIPFSETLYIDKADFNEDNTLSRKKFKRLVSGEYVRLRSAYIIKSEEVIKDDAGEIIELKVSLVPGTVGENVEGVKPRGVIHWVSAEHGVKATIRDYDRLFSDPNPDAGEGDFLAHINPNSLKEYEGVVEPALAAAKPEDSFQFEREGYFVADRFDHAADKLVFNKTIGLRDVWSGK
ncbi:glutamine--tRNA ligase [Oleiphilus sp. HI0009]|nr:MULTISPECIES: glutamine--tRNA ligase/YqeY domain fusion protein [unclassified Oleiphilus]KZX81731.1 glutamine--tRNA ligase [Oleiphilus sp. HI0009]KZY64030.1 glutamine--tRNA ligase [Oleiphilus sp. HI0066]KZY73182.1 glutamine--tRNA ligase [Oleiphilus sp. HI0067]